jgi:hypothetical protein
VAAIGRPTAERDAAAAGIASAAPGKPATAAGRPSVVIAGIPSPEIEEERLLSPGIEERLLSPGTLRFFGNKPAASR